MRPEIELTIHSVEGFNPDTLARALEDLKGQSQGVGVIALDHPTVREAMRALAESGAHIVTIASDILHVPRVGYIGIDNRAAGRLGGYILGRFLGQRKNKIALLPDHFPIAATKSAKWAFVASLRKNFLN